MKWILTTKLKALDKVINFAKIDVINFKTKNVFSDVYYNVSLDGIDFIIKNVLDVVRKDVIIWRDQ